MAYYYMNVQCIFCCTVAEFIDPWQEDKVNSGIGLSYRPFSPHSKKKVREFPVPSRDVTTKLSLGGNNDFITELFLSRGSLVSDIPAGDGKHGNLFLRCMQSGRPVWQSYAGVDFNPPVRAYEFGYSTALLLSLNLKLSFAKFSHFSNIWRVYGAIMYLLEKKGGGGWKERGPLLLFTPLWECTSLAVASEVELLGLELTTLICTHPTFSSLTRPARKLMHKYNSTTPLIWTVRSAGIVSFFKR